MLKYELANYEPMVHETIYGKLEVYEYILYLDNYDIGVMEMAMDETYVFIFNVFLDEDFRGEGIFTSWLRSLEKVIIAFNPVIEARNYWEGIADEIYG